jgi:hypothetical protein
MDAAPNLGQRAASWKVRRWAEFMSDMSPASANGEIGPTMATRLMRESSVADMANVIGQPADEPSTADSSIAR